MMLKTLGLMLICCLSFLFTVMIFELMVGCGEKTYFAEITLNTLEGNVTLPSRPSDAIALAIRSNSKITVDNELFSNNSIILIDENNEEMQEFKDFIDDVSPDDFS